MMDATKYRAGYFPVDKKYNKWALKDHIEKPPVWCSVDMRDGNQSLVIPMSLEEKLEYYKMLLEVGFKEIEVGFPAASETEYEFLRTLIDNHMIPEDVTVQVLTQCREHIIRRTFDACKGAPSAIIHFYNSVSVAQREQVFTMSKEEIKKIAVDGAKLVKRLAGEYERVIEIDLSKIVPTVACPHLPENTHPAAELHHIKIDQVVIGSCTNGRLEDMEAAYSILKGKRVADGVRCIIIPGTMQILRECVERGWYTAFIDAGAVVSTPTCGPCLGGYMGILAAGERCIATTNRNFVGRMGHVDSEVYLASPHTAAASALTGCITEYKEA